MLKLRNAFNLVAKRILFTPTRNIFAKKVATVPALAQDTSHRVPLPCCLPPYFHHDRKPCFDTQKVMVERAEPKTIPMVKAFLYSQYFTREPSFVTLYMPLCSPYLACLADIFSKSGDRFLAFERDPRTEEKTLIGVLVGNKKYPWAIDEYEEWGKNCSEPERLHILFRAHCLRSPDLFKKYHVPFIYEIEVLVTKEQVGGHGVADLLLRSALLYTIEMGYPVTQMTVTNSYTNGPCKRANMKLEWAMKYEEFTDHRGRSLFYPRSPHYTVSIFTYKTDPREGVIPDEMAAPGLYALFHQRLKDSCKDYCANKPWIDTFPALPECPTVKCK